MPDEKLMKAVLDAQKALESRPLGEALETVARAANPLGEKLRAIEQLSGMGRLTETMRMFEENSGMKRLSETMRLFDENSGLKRISETMRVFGEDSSITRMLDTLKLNGELARGALGPMWELRNAGVFDVGMKLHADMGIAQKALADFDARFRLPEMKETAQLLSDLFREDTYAKILSRYPDQERTSLRQAIESMRTPWLDIHESLKSVAGFAEIQGIGAALRSLPAFDESLSATLRLNLGDWRDPITWRPEVLTDLTARSEFYIGLGFNPALTDFPMPAFEQSMDIAGLRRTPLPPLVDGYAAPEATSQEDPEEEGLARTNAAHDRLQRLERLLRKFINEQMTRAFGADWSKHRLPNGLYDQWQEKKRKAEQAGAEERALIEYIDFTDYALLVCRSDNWREVFAAFFNRQESVRETFQRLHPIRLDTAHGRLITQDDELLLHVEVRRLVNAIKKRGN